MSNQKIVLIFDGDCGFCTTTANFMVKHSKVTIEAKPWQYVDFTNLPITKEDCAEQVYLLVDGKPYGGHEGFAMTLRVQPSKVIRFIGLVAMSKALRWFSKPTYRLVAKYRHKLPGGTPACKLPNA
jgi:predicted DCC family thiol-disulfide oxidoreductase YuxK